MPEVRMPTLYDPRHGPDAEWNYSPLQSVSELRDDFDDYGDLQGDCPMKRRHRANEFLYTSSKFPHTPSKCAVCQKKIVSGVTCSSECACVFKNWPNTWREVRYRVWAREKGICQVCGIDTIRLTRILRQTPHFGDGYYAEGSRHCLSIRAWILLQLGFNPSQSMVDCHHRNPVAAHGPAKHTDELMLVCYPCHKTLHGATAAHGSKLDRYLGRLAELRSTSKPLFTREQIRERGRGKKGIRCPRCGSVKWRVTDTMPMPDESIRRYRTCLDCGERVRTIES